MKNWEKLKNNPKRWEIFRTRSLIIKAIREFFWKKGFLEVETPLMVPSLILESTISHFSTEAINCHNKKKKMFLTSSPEAAHKKLLTAGSGNIFEITKSFRNGEDGIENHNCEFSLLEYYRVGADYTEIMKDCENLLKYIFDKLKNKNLKLKVSVKNEKSSNVLVYQNAVIDLVSPWRRISVLAAWEKYTGVKFEEITGSGKDFFPLEKIQKAALRKKYNITKYNYWEEIFNQIFLNEVEPELIKDGQPFILYDYPAPSPMVALAKIKDSDPRFAERFEFYIGGLELGDCYSELTDYKEQVKRFAEEKKVIKLKKHQDNIPDNDYLKALQLGLPKCSGIAIGIDRLVMFFTNSKTIEEVMLFPNGEI